MGKLAFWAAVIALVYAGIKFVSVSQRRQQGAKRRNRANREAEPMLQCAHCGVHVPSSEAVVSGTRAYCSSAHRDAAR